jgi:hypothetical protein
MFGSPVPNIFSVSPSSIMTAFFLRNVGSRRGEFPCVKRRGSLSGFTQNIVGLPQSYCLRKCRSRAVMVSWPPIRALYAPALTRFSHGTSSQTLYRMSSGLISHAHHSFGC